LIISIMKIAYKNLLRAASGVLVSLCLAVPASAQHNGSGGGGGGGSHSSGGGSAPAPAAHSSGGGGGAARPPVSGPGPARTSSAGVSRGAAPQRPTYVYRQGGGIVRTNASGAQTTGARGNYGLPPRSGVAYHTAARVGSYWGVHGYYHFTHGYYNTYYLARLGYTCGVLPYGYYPFFWGDYQYYFCDGLYYTYADDQYTVVEPPIGAEVTSLPDNAQSIVINGQQYYECQGVYYTQVTRDDGSTVYMVAGKDGVLNTTDATTQDAQPQGPQLGDIVAQLPQDCRKLKINGDTLFVSPDGVYYKLQVDASGNKTYKIVGLPSADSDQGSGQ
jgi:hypothetical protein